jgi:hypothetical protein
VQKLASTANKIAFSIKKGEHPQARGDSQRILRFGRQVLRSLFARLTDETEAAVLCALAGRTLADSLDELRAIDRVGGAPASGSPDWQPA